MTDENKIEGFNYGVNQGVQNECFCKSKWFRKFLTTALGSFVGVFCALSLFAALHKPPMPPCPFGPHMMMRPPMHAHHYMGHHKMMKMKHFKDQKDFEHHRMDKNVKINNDNND